MIGYKGARNRYTYVVITLEIPDDAITNINRSNIAVKDTAKYRTNKAKVLKIEDQNGKEYDVAQSCYDHLFEYEVNKMVEVSSYNMDLESVCSAGIHFFLTKECAERYSRFDVKNGPCSEWYEDGSLSYQSHYVNGTRHGLHTMWYKDGKKYAEWSYDNGNEHGRYNIWYPNGQLDTTFTYVNNKIQGLKEEWYENGDKKRECNFVDGKQTGLCKYWHREGDNLVEIHELIPSTT